MEKILSHGKDNKPLGQIQIGSETIDVYGTRPAAIPWPVMVSLFGFKTRAEFVDSVINSCNGKNDISCCFIVQPISKFPTEIDNNNSSSAFPQVKNMACSQSSCLSVNSAEIVAKDLQGKPLPAFLIVPFQGCGGNCSPQYADCINSCSQVQDFVANFDYTKCDGIKVGAGCDEINWLTENDWKVTSDVEQKFYDNKDAL